MKNTLSLSLLSAFHERGEQNGLVLLGFSIKFIFKKTIAHEMSKVPLSLRDDRLHTSLCVMACSLISLKSP